MSCRCWAGVASLVVWCRWLVQKGRAEEARAVLAKLRSPACNIDEELNEIISVCKEDEQAAAEAGNSFVRMMQVPECDT